MNDDFSSSPNLAKKNNRGQVSTPILIAGLLVLLVGAVGAGYWYGKKGAATKVADSTNYNSTITTTVSSQIADTVTTTDTKSLAVEWQKPEKISDVQLFISDIPGFQMPDSYQSAGFYTLYGAYYRVGKVKGSSAEIIFASVTDDGPGGSSYLILKRDQGKLALLARHSQGSIGTVVTTTSAGPVDQSGTLLNNVTQDDSTVIPDLQFPSTVKGVNPKQMVGLDHIRGFDTNSLYFGSGASENFVPAFTDADGEQVYTASSTNAYYLTRGPLVAVYVLQPDFYDMATSNTPAGNIPHITFNDGTSNAAEYSYTERGGCGSMNYLQVVDPKQLSVEKDLVAVGKTNHGDTIYALKNNNHPWLKQLYKDFPTDPKLTYAQFLATRPLLYWVDPFGRLVELQNMKFAPQAECGKPVIYLYPEKTEKVSVKLEPKGGFTKSEPAYNGGWNVVAEPNGILHQIGTDKTYPYLFWEGRGGLYETPKKGWVVKKEEVSSFLDTKLTALGLSAKEIADFKEFWLPRMQAKPYYFVTFMGNDTMNDIAPLTVEPKPTTVIRILMDFTALDKPMSVEPFTIHTPERKGFTVVEWGGVLR